jgi:hypothetical protein
LSGRGVRTTHTSSRLSIGTTTSTSSGFSVGTTPTTSRRSLLFVRREGIISTDGFAQTWKEGCGVGEADIVILIVVAEINVIIFIPRLVVIPLSPGLTKIFVNIRTTCRPIGNLKEDYLLGITNVMRTVWITSGIYLRAS